MTKANLICKAVFGCFYIFVLGHANATLFGARKREFAWEQGGVLSGRYPRNFFFMQRERFWKSENCLRATMGPATVYNVFLDFHSNNN